jgi:hypothetical protein
VQILYNLLRLRMSILLSWLGCKLSLSYMFAIALFLVLLVKMIYILRKIFSRNDLHFACMR